LLDDDGAPDGFDWTVEHRQKAVSRTFDQPSMMLGDRGINEFAPMPLHSRMCPLLVDRHEAAIAGDISRDDSREAP